MKGHFQVFRAAIVILLLAATQTNAADLREAVPSDVYLAIYHRANAERDFQKAYFKDVWNTVEQTQIVEKLAELLQGNLSEEQASEFEGIRTKLAEALKPVDWDAVLNCSEAVYAQKLPNLLPQHLVMIRMKAGGADSCVKAVTNLFEVAEAALGGAVAVAEETENGVTLTSLPLAPIVPIRLCVGTVGDVFVFSSSTEFAREGISLMNRPDAESKFDDPRVKLALSHLPEPEDGLTFFDGKALFQELKAFPTAIRQLAHGDPQVGRLVGLIESVVAQLDAFDFEVTVAYTEGYQNRTASFGRMAEGAGETVVGKMFASQKPFNDWRRWVPAKATSFFLTTGVNLHPLYAWLMETIPRQFREAQPGLNLFAAMQDAVDVHLDEDLLQAFPGELVSVTLPANASSLHKIIQSAMFVHCTKPDRIRELVHRLSAQSQKSSKALLRFSLKPVEGMDEFEEISAPLIAVTMRKPVIGFHGEWMVYAAPAEAAMAVLATQAGNAPSFAESDNFKQFDLKIDGPVSSISYSNLAADIRATAQELQQLGAMAPAIFGTWDPNLPGPDLNQEVLTILPSIGKIIGKFDFYEAQLSVTQPGADGLTYTKRSVTLIRPPGSDANSGSPRD